MMEERNAMHFLQVLLKKTLEGKLKWEPTGSDNAYLLAFSDESVTVGRTRQDNVYVRLTSGRDTTIDFYTSAILARDLEAQFSHNEIDEVLEDLHTAARRSAMRTEAVLSKLLRELENAESAPKPGKKFP